MHHITLRVYRQGPRLTFPQVRPDQHQRLADALAKTHGKIVGFTVSSHAVGLADEPNPTFNPDEPETLCMGLCGSLTELPFHARSPFVFLSP